MIKLVYGTNNPAKLNNMRISTNELALSIIGSGIT